MKYTITYRHMPRSLSLEEHLEAVFTRLGRQPLRAHVVFDRDGRVPAIHCHVTGPRLDFALTERSPDLYSGVHHLGRSIMRVIRRLRR